MSVEAYAILDGGGVKGAALVGCLKAAAEQGIRFIGYGGTSAGSIVALLANVGYSPEEIRKIMVEEINFHDFLDDAERKLQRFKQLPQNLSKSLSKDFVLLKNLDLINEIRQNFGFCNGNKLTHFLLKKIQNSQKVANSESSLKEKLKNATDITFQNLQDIGCSPLKIVASDIKSHQAVVYPQGEGEEALNYSVIKAVRASMSYPFVFTPVIESDRILVDGGLSSNLPVFLFKQEQRKNSKPVIAFDLYSQEYPKSPDAKPKYELGQFCADMLSTIIDSSDDLLRAVTDKVYHVRVPIPANIKTLDFSIDAELRENLFYRGYSATASFLTLNLPQWKKVTNTIEQLQALHAPPYLVKPTLKTIVRDIEETTNLRECRSYIMLPKDENRFAIAYQYNMDEDPDVDWQIDINNKGTWGESWRERKFFLLNVRVLKQEPHAWNMTKPQVNKIPKDRKTIATVPLFNWKTITEITEEDFEKFLQLETTNFQKIIDSYELIGILALDTTTEIEEALNSQGMLTQIYRTMMVGASILSGTLK
ncbi:patatin-like phospholipase family protein [Scytonema sp. NUACC26]|uniref:patatin-like phospholipase family protein n=1 Tax=Scytonema sp. NUACC26 TaxID=3140176 RepID=UPI0034DBEFC8